MADGSKIKKSSRDDDEDTDYEEEEQDDEEDAREDDADDEGEGAGDDEEDGDEPRRRAGPKASRLSWRSVKSWWRNARWWLLPAMLAGACVLFLIGICSVWFQNALGPFMAQQFRGWGAYNAWVFFGTLIVFSVVAYMAGGYIAKRRDFARLVETKSKSDFIRNQDHIERLAFELGKEEQDQVAEKKREFRIRH